MNKKNTCHWWINMQSQSLMVIKPKSILKICFAATLRHSNLRQVVNDTYNDIIISLMFIYIIKWPSSKLHPLTLPNLTSNPRIQDMIAQDGSSHLLKHRQLS